ncbi:MAG: hypothetical protein AB201_00975 [Parcubacteria bacterium C7867-006]|nr:MAG: hypothetical protein AB201_00975 [Parcubacteria bacterium C7867-006]
MASSNKKSFFMHDLSIIALSVLIALILIKTDILSGFLDSTSSFKFLGSFIAGMFFTSVFTTAPAIATLGEIAQHDSVFVTAIFGAMGAVIGDIIIFQFIRDELAVHFVEIIKHNSLWKRFHTLFRLKYFRWFTFMLGGIIIASPFPDELGIGLLGFAKTKTSSFIPVSLAFNFIGILIIGLVARTI